MFYADFEKNINLTVSSITSTVINYTKYCIAVFRVRVVPSAFGGSELLLVLVNGLDREQQGSYTLKLVARDYGRPSRLVLLFPPLESKNIDNAMQ